MNFGGPGFLDIGVEVPNSDNSTSFQVHQVDKITLNSTVQPEVIVYSVVGGNTGIIQLEIVRTDPGTLKVIYNQKVNVTYGCSASTFSSVLKNFDGFYSYAISVVRNIYDSKNNLTDSTINASRIDYVTEIYKLREDQYQNEKFKVQYFNNFTGDFTQTRTQTHSPVVSGSWALTIGGRQVMVNGNASISYGVSAGDLQNGIRATGIVGFENIEVSLSTTYGC